MALKEAKIKSSGINFREVDYIEDLELNVPLFVRIGNSLKWAHKSLQDYFAAEFIASSVEKENIIKLIHKSGRDNYLNIIDFLYEQDYRLFRKIIIYPIIEEYLKYCDSTYRSITYNYDKIRERQALTFGITVGIYVCDDKTKDFEDAEKAFSGIFTFTHGRIIGRTGDGSGYIYELFKYSFDRQILKLLYNRNELIFNRKKFVDGGTIRDKLGNDFPKDTPILINDNPDNIMNTEKYFDVFNSTLAHDGYIFGFSNKGLLDYDKCKRMKTKIEEEMIADSQNDVLNGI